MDLLGLGVVGFTGALLIVLSLLARKTPLKLRAISALTRLYHSVGASVEDGTRILTSVGGASLLTKNGASALAGLGLLRHITQRTSVSDRPPVAVAGEASLSILAQDTMESGYKAAGAAGFYEPTAGRLAGMTPFASTAGTMPIMQDENVSAVVLMGHFGVEAALLADVAERSNAFLLGASDEPAAQAALYASAAEALIGEELFAAHAYLDGSPSRAASLTAQDVLRWSIIIVLIVGAGLKLLGFI